MKREAIEFKVGILACVAIGLLCTMIIYFGELKLFRDTYGLIAYFPTVGDIEVGAPVRLGGILVGRVSEIRRTTEEERRMSSKENEPQNEVRVVLQIFDDQKIPKDAKLQIIRVGILGESYFEFRGGSPDAPPLEDGDELLTGKVSPDLADITSEVMEILEELRPKILQAIDKINAFISDEDMINNFKDTVRYTAETTSKGPEIADKIDQFVVDGRAMIVDTRSLIARLDKSAQTLETELPELAGKYKELANRLEKVITPLENVTKESNENSTIAKLLATDEAHQKLVETMDEAKSAFEQIRKLAETLEENPQSMFWGRQKKKSGFNIPILDLLPFGKKETEVQNATTPASNTPTDKNSPNGKD